MSSWPWRWRCFVSAAVNSRVATAGVILGVLGLTGAALQSVAERVGLEISLSEPAPRLDSGAGLTKQAAVQGLLGGFRAVVADIIWLEAHSHAADRDLPGTESLLELVTLIDPRPLYFWLNGARILAYDMPTWRVAGAGVAETGRFSCEQAQRALRRLEKARTFHPDSAALWIEQANIEFNRLGDVAEAAASYRRAAEQPDAPYYAARLHAEMLRRIGRKAEALIWLVRLHPQLPPTEESAGADLVLTRIRGLERELGVPEAQKYRPNARQDIDGPAGR